MESPFFPPTGFRGRRLAKKVAAGAEFVQTQFAHAVFERFMADVRDRGVGGRCGISAGVGPVRSLRTPECMRTTVGSGCAG